MGRKRWVVGGWVVVGLTFAGAAAAQTTTAPKPTSDTAVGLLVDPNPASVGAPMAITVTATNLGPTIPATMTARNALPGSVRFQGLVATTGAKCTIPTVGASGTITCVWAKPGIGAAQSMTITAIPTRQVTLSNVASVASSNTDTVPANNRVTGVIGTIPFGQAIGGVRCTIVGTPGDDVLSGTDGNDVICGLGGNDTIHGWRGDDLIDGGDGNDTVFGDTGADRVYGRGGDDRVYGGHDRDLVAGGPGNDFVAGGRGADVHWGGSGFDTALLRGRGDRVFRIERRIRIR